MDVLIRQEANWPVVSTLYRMQQYAVPIGMLHCRDSSLQTLACSPNLLYTVNLPHAVTLNGAEDGDGVFPVGLLGHVICCSGR